MSATPSTGIRITSEEVEDTTVFVVEGELDLATVPELDRSLLTLADRSDHPAVIDLTRCSFIDSSGLRALMAAHRDGAGPARLVLVAGPGQVRRILELTAVADVIPLVATRAEALETLRA